MEIKTIEELKNRVYDMMVTKDEEIRELNKRIMRLERTVSSMAEYFNEVNDSPTA